MRCFLLLALASSTAALVIHDRTGILPGGPGEATVMVNENAVSVQVEIAEGGGLLIDTELTARAAEPAPGNLLLQLSVPIASLCLGFGIYGLLPRFQLLAKLLLFFGAQSFMNIYMKAILSNSVVSEELHMRGFQAPLVLTALQQLVGFAFLALAVLVSQLTPWAYKPVLVQSKDQVIAVVGLAVCFTLNIALNNFSLSLIDMSVNVMIRSSSPLTSLILQLCFRSWFDDVDVRPAKVCMMMLGVSFALLVVISKHAGTKHPDESADTLGLVLCLASLIFSSMELIAVVIVGKGFKLNSIDTLLYMALPVFVLLLLPSFLVRHPVAYPGHSPTTDFKVFMEVARLSPTTVVLVMLSGIWALGYNLLLYNIVMGLSPYFASFAANFNKVAAIGLAVLMGLETLPEGHWKYLMCLGVLGNMASFTAYGMWPKQSDDQIIATPRQHREKAGDVPR